MPAFSFKTTPFAAQRRVVAERWHRPYHALLWQQRCGKSKVVLDDFAVNVTAGHLDTLIVTAPAGVHIGWIAEQVPQHLAIDARTWLWDSRVAYAWRKREERGEVNTYTARFKAWCAEPGPKIFAHNIDSVRTDYGAKVVKYVLTHTSAMWAIDEADDLTDPTSDRSTVILSLGAYARKRRVLSGSLATGGPFAYYAPMAFMSPDFWRQHGYRLDHVMRYKKFFAEFEQKSFRSQQRVWVVAKDEMGKKKYRNFDVFHRLVDPHVSRVLQADVYPEIAARQRSIVQTEFFALSDAGRAAYRELRHGFLTTAPSGRVVDGLNPAVRMMRLHQITCGYVATTKEEPVELLPGPNPRIEALLRAVTKLGEREKVIVWTAFTMDQHLVVDALTAAGYACGRYDGQTVGTRERDKSRFLGEREPRVLVANVQAMSRGHDLTVANHEVFYSYPYRLLYFAQACERLKGPNQTRPIFRHWLVAHGTVDEKIRRAYENNQEIADALTGDTPTDLGLDADLALK